MTPYTYNERTVLAFLVVLLAARLAAGAVLIPPWQGPDEPQHVFQITLIAGGYPLQSSAEAALVSSMYRHSWWEHYQRPRPSIPPKNFLEGPAKVTEVKGAPGGPLLFHATAGAAFRRAGIGDVERQFWWLRFSSALMAMLTFAALCAANRLAFGLEAGLASAAIVALQPQFLLVSLSANPDAVVLLLGALTWLSAALVLTGRSVAAALTLAWVCAAVGVLVRRVAFPLLFDAGVVSAVAIAFSEFRRAASGAIALAVVALAGAAWTLAREHVIAASSWIADVLTPVDALRGLVADPGFAALLARTLFKSYWLTAGWMRYEAPTWWYAGLLVVCAAAFIGCIRVLRRHALLPRHVRVALFVAAAFVVVQVAAVFVAYIPLRAGVQGRYLMPVIGPAAGLIAVGLVHGWPFATPRHGVTAAIALFAVVDLLSWGLVLLPTYAWS